MTEQLEVANRNEYISIATSFFTYKIGCKSKEEKLMRRKNIFKIGLAVLLSTTLFLSSACGDGDSAKTTDAQNVSAKNLDSEDSDDTLVFSCNNEISNIDIIHAYSIDNNAIDTAIAEQLFYYDFDSNIQKGLVEKEEQPADNIYVYDIKQNVKFSDGTPLTAEDVVYSLDRQRDPDLPGELAWMFEDVESIEQTGDYQVTVTLKEPDATWPYAMATTASLVISKKYAEEHSEDFGTATGGFIGSGPYVLSSWEQGSEIVLTKNENYWDDTVKLDFNKVVFKFITDASVAKVALENGDVDIITQLAVDSANELESSPNVNIQPVDMFAENFLSFNTSKEPFNDVNVRKAIAYAINKQTLVDSVYYGKYAGVANALPFGESIITTEKDEWTDYLANVEKYEYDLDKAKDYLSKSSVPDGFSATLCYSTGSPQDESLALIIQQNLKDIGIEITLEGRASSEIVTQRYGGSETRDYELMITGWGSDYPDPVGVILPMFVSDYTVAGGSNWVEYKSDDFDKYMALQGEELDPVKRAKDLQDALDVFADDIPSYPIVYQYDIYGISSRIDYTVSQSCLYNLFIKDIKKADK